MKIKNLLQDLKLTILWILIIPCVILIDLVIYILGIFFKEFRIIYTSNLSINIKLGGNNNQN